VLRQLSNRLSECYDAFLATFEFFKGCGCSKITAEDVEFIETAYIDLSFAARLEMLSSTEPGTRMSDEVIAFLCSLDDPLWDLFCLWKFGFCKAEHGMTLLKISHCESETFEDFFALCLEAISNGGGDE